MKTILFVDDDPVIVRVYQQYLSNGGFRVETAGDGLSAMKILPQLCPDLVVLDVLMPKVDGIYVLKFIHSRPELKSSKVIVLSEAINADIGKRVLELHPDRALLKSQTSPAEVLATARELLADPPPELPLG